ncbi:TonB-dependent receptor plug domain-containing protein [Maribellus sp. CM-23]|uniref:TonB-dependent receptor plug domain-containing protein n=1 Tax=Maribellus sp. CM-23 TaxID=2781026 RepID=UPI001F436631|nr:TonB-dependent receptor plug domain-containing protein [Maribellus sp. CM-23]MCE4565688.1 TonB-dependent receptor plug domain-containing protein [Maribellus sp. CM-23]
MNTMKARISLFLTVFFVLAFLVGNAQERLVKGIVTTFDSIPLIGADVQVAGSKELVKTDTLGRFSVNVNPGDKLKVSAKGFNTQKVKLDDKIKMVLVNLKLKPTESAREYAIGYGYVKDADKLNAVAQLNSKDLDFSQYTNMYDLIRGRFGGVQVSPGGEIIIRGVSSINLSSAALIVVDGVAVDNSMLNNLSPTNVQSINIIKDGSAAIYGARGANGVVIIETKRGKDD